MPARSNPATPSKRRADFTITEAELEAKRRHTQSCSIEELEEIVKDEPRPEESPVDALLSIAAGGPSERTNDNGNTCSSVGTALNSFAESVRVLALSFQEYDKDNDFLHGAFLTVLRRRSDLTKDPRACATPIPDLEEWMMELLQQMELPTGNHSSICSALREAAIGRVVSSWLPGRSAAEILATFDLLQGVLQHGNHAVLDVVYALDASRQSPASSAHQNRPANETAESRSVAIVRHAKRATADEVSKPSKRRTATNALAVAWERHSQSSSPALAEFREAHEKMRTHLTVASAPSNAFNWKTSKPTVSSVCRSPSHASLALRYIQPDRSNLLLFFVGDGMRDVQREEIIAACSKSYQKHPFHTHRWSKTVWVAQMINMPGVSTDLISLRDVRLTATNTNSDPSGHFVASFDEFEVEDEQLKSAVTNGIADLYRGKPPGKLVIYRAPSSTKHGHLVFLHLFNAPPTLLFPIAVVDGSAKPHIIIFKPAIKDFEEDCFYCDRAHDDLVCPIAVQISSFGKCTKRSSRARG